MKLSVRISIDGLKRKLTRVKGELPRLAEDALLTLGAEAIEQVRSAPARDRRAAIERAISRQLRAIFIPVTLQHKCPEKWPDLPSLYRARILRGQRTVGGRKQFYVDEHKEEALRRELLQRALRQGSKARFEVRFIATSDRRYRVEIISRGAGKHAAPVMIAYAKQRMKHIAADTLQTALSRSGLR